MLNAYTLGQTSVILRVKLLNSSVATAAGLTGLSYTSSGLVISTIADNEASPVVYAQGSSNIEDITALGTYTTPTTDKCRFKEVSSSNHPGIYEIQLPNTRFAVSNAKSLLVSIHGAADLVQTDFIIALVRDDPYIAKPTNSNLLSIDANGRIDVIKIAGTTQTARDIGASVLLSNGTGTGQISLSSGLVDVTQTAADKTWSTSTRILTANTNLSIPTVENIRTEIDTNSTMLQSLDTDVNSIISTLPTNFADLFIEPTTGRVEATDDTIDSISADVEFALDNRLLSDESTAVLESYLDGSEYMPVDPYKLTFSVSGSDLVVKKPDGTTTAYTKSLTTDAGALPVIGSN